jgi:hypothetical protein
MASATFKENLIKAWDEKVVVGLQDPHTLRITVLSVIGVLGLGMIGLPLYSSIGTLQIQLSREKERATLIKEQTLLTTRMKQYKKRLPENGTMNWWTGYLVDASRDSGLKIAEFKPYVAQSPRANIGMRRGMLLRFEVVGPFAKVLRFIGWLETQNTIVHIASITMVKESQAAPLRTTITIGVLTDRMEAKKVMAKLQKEDKGKKKDTINASDH